MVVGVTSSHIGRYIVHSMNRSVHVQLYRVGASLIAVRLPIIQTKFAVRKPLRRTTDAFSAFRLRAYDSCAKTQNKQA